MADKKLFLIDGSALYYRSYYAFIRNPMISSKGENTSACFGAALYMLKILQEEKPDYIAVVFDTKEPTFRHKMYDAYKATREKMPEEMAAQYPRLLEMIEAFNVPTLELDGYEADDIIGTLARRAEAQGIVVYMATSDKDMMQLISPKVKMYSMRSGDSVVVFDEKALMEKHSLRPEQIIDYLALMGDSSDNVPGVPRVGEKTAKSLLAEFGSLDGIYQNLDKISKKSIKASLEENRELAELSRRLVTIDTNVPLDVDLEALKAGPVHKEKLIRLFEELEFNSLIPRIAGDEVATLGAPQQQYDREKQEYQLITTESALNEVVAELRQQSFLVFDTETTGLAAFNSEVIGVAFSWNPHQGCYIPVGVEGQPIPAEQIWAALKPVFENPAIKKGGQNLKFDALMLWQHGIRVEGIDFDTMIASYLLTPGGRQNNLDALAEKYLNYKMISIETLIGKKGKKQKSMRDVPVEQISPYACEDADITLQLKLVLEKKLKESDTEELFRTVEMPLVEVLLEMEKTGVGLDVEFLKQMSLNLAREADRLKQEVFEIAGEEFNLNSPQQLGVILFDKLEIHKDLGGRRPKRTPTGQYSTSEAVLMRYSKHPVVEKILEYRKLTKLRSTYVEALPALISPRTGRVHTSFNQTVAATGRLSSSDPNLQNIPIRGEKGREIRKAFIPWSKEHLILSADYSQIELRVMAHMSGDQALKQAFEHGEDIHSSTAVAIFNLENLDQVTPEQRRKAKAINFGIIYGISSYGLASRLDISPGEAEEIIRNYFIRFPGVNEYMMSTIAFAREHKYVTTILKRRRYIPDILSDNRNIRENAERIAINTTIQGSAADLIKLAMIRIHRRIQSEKLDTKMILQVHDELVFDVPAQELETVKVLVKKEMENALELNVPIRVDIGVGKNWLEAH